MEILKFHYYLNHKMRYKNYKKKMMESKKFFKHISDIQSILRSDGKPNNEHARKYNTPSASEIAVIIPVSRDGTESIGKRDIILHARDGKLQRIHETHRLYDPLHYVIIHPTGEPG